MVPGQNHSRWHARCLSLGMHLWRRVLYRAEVLTENWMHNHAFEVGLLFGGSLSLLATLLIVVH
jgi:hypothetical protein